MAQANMRAASMTGDEGLGLADRDIATDMTTDMVTETAADMSATWARVSARLRRELGEAVYGSWFGRLELDGVADGVALLSVPTRFLKSWIQSHYLDRILACLQGEELSVGSVQIDVRSGVRSGRPRAVSPLAAPAPRSDAAPALRLVQTQAPHGASQHALASHVLASHAPAAHAASDRDLLAGSPLDRRLTFSSFAVGRSNQLAHAAAQRVAESAGEAPLYNPLYLHAAVGLGKTHLLQAIAHAATDAGKRVIYLTAERFMYGFVAALKTQNAIAFKETLRAIDVLIIDDIQFLQGKTMQQEFCHTLNALIDARKQIVIAADRPPIDLDSLDERARSRLVGGLSVEIEAYDETLREKILAQRVAAARAAHAGFDVSAQVLAYVASAIQSNGRDLEGAVNRLLAHATLSGQAITVETAESAIRDLVRAREPRRVKIEDIQKLVGNHYSVTRADILSSRRTANVVRPRQIAMYLSKILTPRSLPEIGRRFGGRDHTTVLHAVRKIDALAAKDRALSEEIELLKRMLQD
jgi:chromosomal replication initiator protein